MPLGKLNNASLVHFVHWLHWKMLPKLPCAYVVHIKCNDAWIIILHENYSAHNVFDKFSRLLLAQRTKFRSVIFQKRRAESFNQLAFFFSQSIKCFGIYINIKDGKSAPNLENLIAIRRNDMKNFLNGWEFGCDV